MVGHCDPPTPYGLGKKMSPVKYEKGASLYDLLISRNPWVKKGSVKKSKGVDRVGDEKMWGKPLFRFKPPEGAFFLVCII